MIDHEKRLGHPYQPKRPPTDEERKRRSEAMKAYHLKTHKGTAAGNRVALKSRRKK